MLNFKSILVATMLTWTVGANGDNLCRNCSLKITFLDATGTGSGPAARASAQCFVDTLPIISSMPLQSEPAGEEMGISLIAATYPEYAAQNSLDALDVAIAARGIAKHCLRDTAGYQISLDVYGFTESATNNVGTIGH